MCLQECTSVLSAYLRGVYDMCLQECTSVLSAYLTLIRRETFTSGHRLKLKLPAHLARALTLTRNPYPLTLTPNP